MHFLFYIGFLYFIFYNYTSKICQFLLHFLGFQVSISLHDYPSKLIIISSHTSIYDFFLGIIIYYGYFHQKYKLYCLMKKLFESMVSPFLLFLDNKLQIISVDHTKKGLTQQIISKLENKDHYCIYIAPEGTRKLTNTLRKGYHVIAKELNIRVAYLGVDFHKKIIQLEKDYEVNPEWESEQQYFIEQSKKYLPLYPEKCYWTKDYYHSESLSSSLSDS